VTVPAVDTAALQLGTNRSAVERVVGRPLLALALYLPGALLGLLASLPLQAGLERFSRGGPWVGQLASRDWLAALTELSGQQAAGLALGEAPSGELVQLVLTALGSLATVGLGLPLHGLIYSFASGGLLARLRGESGGFWRHCRAWFWPQARLGLLGLLLLGLELALGLGLLVVLALSSREALALGVGALAALLLGLNGLLELARAGLVARSDRRARYALARSVQLLGRPRRLLVALLCWLGLALLGAVLAAAGAALHLTSLPPLPLALGFQIVAFAGAWLKLLRLAVAVELSDRLNSGRSPAPRAQPVA
jgi:hypothetical protein